MARYNGPVFVLELPLKTEPWQECIIDRRMEVGRNMYNALTNMMLKQYYEMTKTKKYRGLIESITGNKKHDAPIWREINQIHMKFGFSEFSFQEKIKPMQHHFKKVIDSTVAQKIATAVWKAFDKLLYGNGKKIHFKKYGDLNSLEGKSAISGIKFMDTYIDWMGLKLSFVIEIGNQYEEDAITNQVSYCRIVRKWIRGKYKYYAQLVLRGVPPIKINKTTGEAKRQLGSGDVGIDIGPSTIAYCSQNEVAIKELANKAQGFENKKRLLLRKLERSRRATNPDNYNTDGTVKTGKKKWIQSNHYKRDKNILKEIYRKQATVRRYQHECEANHIMSLGDKFYIEKMNFQGLAKRSTKTEKTSTGKNKSKKRYGKSIANRAPAMLENILRRKLKYSGVELVEINTIKARASQFNHIELTYKKKKLSQRWNIINGNKVQRDLYSAFLIMNISSDLETFDLEKCNIRFARFLELHEIEVKRLTGNKNLSSISI